MLFSVLSFELYLRNNRQVGTAKEPFCWLSFIRIQTRFPVHSIHLAIHILFFSYFKHVSNPNPHISNTARPGLQAQKAKERKGEGTNQQGKLLRVYWSLFLRSRRSTTTTERCISRIHRLAHTLYQNTQFNQSSSDASLTSCLLLLKDYLSLPCCGSAVANYNPRTLMSAIILWVGWGRYAYIQA